MIGQIAGILFAEADHWREMGRDFRVDHDKLDPTLIIASVIVLTTVVLFLWFLHRMMNRQEGRRVYNSPKQLFRSLCRLHELSGPERRALTSLARGEQPTQPAILFLSPERFDAAIAVTKSASQRNLLENLRAKLFADLIA
jgi:hypothetical protein